MQISVRGRKQHNQGSGLLGWSVLVMGLCLLMQCTDRENQIAFEGEYFRAKASKLDRDDQQSFTVQVGGIERSFEGALQAGAYEATSYCINNFGTSDIAWLSGPDDDPETLTIERGNLTLRGTCIF